MSACQSEGESGALRGCWGECGQIKCLDLNTSAWASTTTQSPWAARPSEAHYKAIQLEWIPPFSTAGFIVKKVLVLQWDERAFIEQLIMIQSHLSEHLSLSCITLQGDNCLVGRVCSGWAFPHTIPWQASGHFVYLCSFVLSSPTCRGISLVQNPASEKSHWSNMLISCNVTKVATDNFFHIVAYKKNYQKSTWYYALVVDWIKADLNSNVVDCKKLDGFNMEDCFCHGIKNK